jgi:hypothetical protein
MTAIPMARRLASTLAAVAAAAALAACAVSAMPQDVVSAPTPTPAGSPAPTAAPAAARKPPTLLRFAAEPADAVFRAGETVRMTVVISNAEISPLTVADLPPAVTLVRPTGERVRTLPGGAEAVTLPPGGAYRHPVAWDGRRDDGSPAPAGRYGLALSTVRVGGGTQLTAGAGGVVLHPAGGVRLGELRPGLSATNEGATMTLERLVMGEREARFEARVVPALPNRSARPIGDWRVEASYRLDGAPPEAMPSPGAGVDDPGRTTLTWALDPLPATAQALDLTVGVGGEARGHWGLRRELHEARDLGIGPQRVHVGQVRRGEVAQGQARGRQHRLVSLLPRPARGAAETELIRHRAGRSAIVPVSRFSWCWRGREPLTGHLVVPDRPDERSQTPRPAGRGVSPFPASATVRRRSGEHPPRSV